MNWFLMKKICTMKNIKMFWKQFVTIEIRYDGLKTNWINNVIFEEYVEY